MRKGLFIFLLLSHLIYSDVFLIGQANEIVKTLEDGVVIIRSYQGIHLSAEGTGIVVGVESNKVFILTASHVCINVEKIRIEFRQLPGEMFRAEDVGINKSNCDLDIAIIKVDLPFKRLNKSFPKLKMGDLKEIRPGDKVIGICHPYEYYWLTQHSRVLNPANKEHGNILPIAKDCIGIGCSGGPIFNEQIELIGMITQIDPIGAFAIKIDAITKVLEQNRIPTNLITFDAPCFLSITTVPPDSEIYIDNNYIGSKLAGIQLKTGRRYNLEIRKPGYKDYVKLIDCETRKIPVILEEIEDYICPTPQPRPFESLKNGMEVSPGEPISVSEIFKYCSKMKYWLCFIDNNNRVWPKTNVPGPKFTSSAAVPKTGFNRGKFVLACVQKEIDIKFNKWLAGGSDKPLYKPKIFGVILETNVNVNTR